jgi:hypothetical protein
MVLRQDVYEEIDMDQFGLHAKLGLHYIERNSTHCSIHFHKYNVSSVSGNARKLVRTRDLSVWAM